MGLFKGVLHSAGAIHMDVVICLCRCLVVVCVVANFSCGLEGQSMLLQQRPDLLFYHYLSGDAVVRF